MGGFGCWAAVALAPHLFSAVVAVCGGFCFPMSPRTSLREVVHLANKDWTDEEVAPVLSIRAWLFHGAKDVRVAVEGSSRLYDKLGGSNRNRDELRMTVYPAAGHACWGKAYRTPGLIKWLAAGKRSRLPQSTLDSATQ